MGIRTDVEDSIRGKLPHGVILIERESDAIPAVAITYGGLLEDEDMSLQLHTAMVWIGVIYRRDDPQDLVDQVRVVVEDAGYTVAAIRASEQERTLPGGKTPRDVVMMRIW